MAKSIEHIVRHCNDCKKDTNHSVVSSYLDPFRIVAPDGYEEELDFGNNYRIIKCDGCGYISFERVTDFDDLPGEVNGDRTEIISYPPKQIVYEDEAFNSKLNNNQTKDIYKMYQEAITAINNNCLQLATIGFRAVVEAICKNQVSKDGRLVGLIDELEAQGLVSRLEKDRLHKIRLEGNITVHQFRDIPLDDVLYIKEVVDHIIKSLYIFEK